MKVPFNSGTCRSPQMSRTDIWCHYPQSTYRCHSSVHLRSNHLMRTEENFHGSEMRPALYRETCVSRCSLLLVEPMPASEWPSSPCKRCSAPRFFVSLSVPGRYPVFCSKSFGVPLRASQCWQWWHLVGVLSLRQPQTPCREVKTATPQMKYSFLLLSPASWRAGSLCRAASALSANSVPLASLVW